jgi:hypothetical protein
MGIVSSLVNFEVDIFVKLASSVTKKIPLSPPEGVKKFRCSGSLIAKVNFFYGLSKCVSHEQF